MKKTSAIFFLLFYCLSNAGATVHFHYCMNKFAGWDLFHNEKTNCAKCGMDKAKSNGCCHDENKRIKIINEHQQSIAGYSFNIFSTVALIHSFFNCTEKNSPFTKKYSADHSPPDKQKVPLYIFYCVYRN